MNGDRVKITILVDNQAAPGLTAEHGLSFLIETGGTSIKVLQAALGELVVPGYAGAIYYL